MSAPSDTTSPARPVPAGQESAPPPARWRRIDVTLVGGLVLLVAFLLPTLRNGYRGDDTWTSELRGMLELGDQSLADHLWDAITNFWNSGRPTVVGVPQGLVFSWALNDKPVLYHAVLVVLVAVAAWALYALVREFGLPRSVGLLAIVLVAGTIQLRSFHDPVLGYFGTTQIVLALTLVSLLLFLRGLRRDDRRLVWAAFALFLFCPLLYEGAYPLAVLFLAVALFERRGWAAWRASLPFLALGVAFVALSLYLRSAATALVPGYEVGGSLWGMLRTFLIQLFAPIPGSTLLFRAEHANFLPLGTSPTKAELLAGAWRGAAVFAVVLVVGLRAARQGAARLPAARTLGVLAVVGGLLWTASVVAVSAAPKYQFELVPGKGHLPTIIQTFGWALVMVAAVLALVRVSARRSRAAATLVVLGAAGLLGFGAAANGYNNMRVVALEVPITKARALIETAADRGVLDATPAGATLLFSPRDMQWNTGQFAQVPESLRAMLMDRAGRDYDSRPTTPTTVFRCEPAAAADPNCLGPVQPQAAWVRVRTHRGGGSVIVGRIDGSTGRPADSVVTRDIRVYVQSDGSDGPAPPELIAPTPAGKPWNSRSLSWRREGGEGDWAIYSARVTGPAPVASQLDDAQAKVDFTALGPPDQIVRVHGTKHLLP